MLRTVRAARFLFIGPLILLLLVAASLFTGRGLAASGFERNLEKSFPVAPGGTLIVEADQGSIEVASQEAGQVQVRVLRRVKGGNQSQADDLFANHDVRFQQEGDTVSVIAKTKTPSRRLFRFGRSSFEVRFEVTVPRRYNVDLGTAGDDIRVGDLEGTVKSRTSSGSITLTKATGAVEASDSGGDIRVDDAGGDIVARTSSGSIKLGAAKGTVHASNSGGDIRVDDAGRDVKAETSSGTIHLKAVQGDVDVRNSGGDIKVESAGGSVVARTSSGTIDLKQAKGKSVQARNSGGDVIIGDASGDVVAQTSRGAIKIGTVGGKLQAGNSGGDIDVGEAAGDVVLQTSSGSIKVGVAKGKVEAKNSGGEISVAQAETDVVAQTSSGPLIVKSAAGPVTARNSGGDIEIDHARGVVQADTSSGSIHVAWTASPEKDCRLTISGGDITVGLPKSAALNLDAQSSGGKVVADFPVTVTVQGEQKPGTLRGKINDGGPAMVLRASGGDIRLKAGSD